MAGSDSALREKTLRGKNARRLMLRLPCGLRLRRGLCLGWR
jgi:hypothetical protein